MQGGSWQSENRRGEKLLILFPPGLKPGTSRMLGERENHHTTETTYTVVIPSFLDTLKSLLSKWSDDGIRCIYLYHGLAK